MGTVFNKEEMLVLLQDFHRLTGLRTVVFDTYGMDILSYPPELPAYCKLVRGVPEDGDIIVEQITEPAEYKRVSRTYEAR